MPFRIIPRLACYPKGTVLTIKFTLQGQEFMVINGGNQVDCGWFGDEESHREAAGAFIEGFRTPHGEPKHGIFFMYPLTAFHCNIRLMQEG